MHATSSYENSGSKVAKIAIVTLLHAGVALAMISMRVAPPPSENGPGVIIVEPEPIAKVIPPDPAPIDPPPTNAAPPIYVPLTNVSVDVSPDLPVPTTWNALPTQPSQPMLGPSVIAEVVPTVIAKVVAKQSFHAAQSGDCALPIYPAASARNGDAGTVGLALLIAPDGHVAESKVSSTSGFRELDRAAMAALSLCKFKPATTNGVPESAWGKIAYVWTLEQ